MTYSAAGHPVLTCLPRGTHATRPRHLLPDQLHWLEVDNGLADSAGQIGRRYILRGAWGPDRPRATPPRATPRGLAEPPRPDQAGTATGSTPYRARIARTRASSSAVGGMSGLPVYA